MKKILTPCLFLLLVGLIGLSASCHRPQPTPEPIPDSFANGLYILNEGVFQMNNSTLSYYNFDTGEISQDLFLQQNGRGLGDTGNDLQRYGSKLYCVVNNSNTLEVLRSDGTSIKAIALTGKEPRYIAFYHNKAYVSCFDGDVVKIDTATLEIDGSVHSGPNPEGICACNGKLYVSNSGGLNNPNYGHTVSVIDPNTFSVTKEIEVGINPGILQSYRDHYVYLVTRGDYGDVPYNFLKIDAQTDEVVKTYDMAVLNFTINDHYAYIYHYDFYTYDSWIKVMDLNTDEIVSENFITDGTQIETPYGICVNPLNGDVFISDALSFSVSGKIYWFDKGGKLKKSFTTGINPGHLLLNTPVEDITLR
ncbi:MAG: hypothetical protein IKU03_03240 [Bacteroidales bacterium]|nr:hypothetical protein [Bacteroidales bacterium]